MQLDDFRIGSSVNIKNLKILTRSATVNLYTMDEDKGRGTGFSAQMVKHEIVVY